MKINLFNGLLLLLKSLSHNRNLLTDVQMSKILEQDTFDAKKPNIYLEHIRKFLDYKDKTIIEIGCGTGDFAISLAKSGAQKVVGIDVDKERIRSAKRKAIMERVDNKTSFICVDFNNYPSNDIFDIAFSLNAFEHIPSPFTSLKQIYDRLIPEGVFCTIFGPLWLSPYGAHMWSSLLFHGFIFFSQKKSIKGATEYYRPDDPVFRYEDVRGHLNRITVKKFIHFASEAGFKLQTLKVNPAQDNGKFKFANAIINKVYFLKQLCSFQLLAV